MLPKEFKPIYIENNELIRLGSLDDGGYVVPRNTILSSKLLVSLGISDNWDFEKDFVKMSKVSVYGFDHSIHINFWLSKFKKDLFKFLCFKIFKPKKLYKMFQFIDFLIFFKINKNNKFFLKKVGNKKDNEITFRDIISNKCKNKKNIFLKIDIEGFEYEILDDIINLKNLLQGVVIEFHNISKNVSKITKFINNIKPDLYLVHIHGNNYSVKEKNKDPEAIELTFSKSSLHPVNKVNNKTYPIKNLDFSNSKRSPDIDLLFKE